MNALATIEPAKNVDAYRASTDAAMLCKEIVVATASTIQGRKYVGVEGWQAIAVAHGCAASAREVERIDGGVRAVGEIRRMSDGAIIATAEGFVGEDEAVWFGGVDARGKTHAKRPDYAIRAMAQTRAISRAARSAFAHVVVMMKAGLQTTPAEEVPAGGFDDGEGRQRPAPLTGKHKTRAALRTAAGEIQTKLAEAADGGDESHVRQVEQDYAEDIEQIKTEGPADWWEHPDWGLRTLIMRAYERVHAPRTGEEGHIPGVDPK